ncbi:MAG TPA: hypothetical protein VFJ51_09535, partial [Nitrososphaeraceae archaeon]|nr:hypothetical protein [Nitrososphaeraceae archaeon]
GKLYDSLIKEPDGKNIIEQARQYLLTKHIFLNENGEQENISFIEWLKDHRIELNKILAEIKSEPFFNWLKWKLDQVFPYRNCNRAITMDTPIFIDDTTIITPTVKKFNEWKKKSKKLPMIL